MKKKIILLLLAASSLALADSNLVNGKGGGVSDPAAFRNAIGLNNVANIKSKFDGTVAPTTGDDSDDGYSVGSVWFDTVAGDQYYCIDATVGAAVWDRIQPDSELGTIASQDANNVAITGGTITGLSAATITGDLTVDTSTLKVNSTTNCIGVGTASPAYPIDLAINVSGYSTMMANGAYHGYKDSGGTARTLIGASGDNVIVGGASTDAVYMQADFEFPALFDATGLQIGTGNTIRFADNSGTLNGTTISGPWTASGAWTFSSDLTASSDIYVRGAVGGNAAINIQTQSSAHSGFSIKTSASQTAAAFQVSDSAGNARAGFDNVGNYYLYAANNSQGFYLADQSAPSGSEKRSSFTLRGGYSQHFFINPGRDVSNNAGDISLCSDVTGNVVIGSYSPSGAKLHVEGSTKLNGDIQTDKTITAAATTGAQTINKNAGSVNFAAAATSLVVTNSRVTTSSVIICTIGTNDATMTSVQAVAGSGSFTIYANAAPTAETRVNFLIIN